LAIMAGVAKKAGRESEALYKQIRDARRNVVAIRKRFGSDGHDWKVAGTFLDCGANIGEVSRAAAEIFDKVIAIEAHPDTAKVLRERTKGYKNVTVRNAAVSNVTGKTFHVSSPSYCSIGATARETPRRDDKAYYRRVKSVALQDLILEFDPVAIKIDIEGSEFDALRDLRLPDRVTYLVVEFHGLPSRIAPIVAHICAQGYRAEGFSDKTSYTLQTVKFERS
jgi:FkbM family methyltransferase